MAESDSSETDSCDCLIDFARDDFKEVKRVLLNCDTTDYPSFCDQFMQLWQISILHGHIEAAKFLMDEAVNVNSRREDGPYSHPLVVACKTGRKAIVNYLLVLEPQQRYVTPKLLQFALSLSSQLGREEIVVALLSAGADPSEVISADEEKFDRYGIFDSSPLVLACQNGHAGVVDILLKHGAEVNCTRHADNYSPLHIASEIGHVDIVGHLIRHDASVYVEANDNVTPLHLAARRGALKIVEMLLYDGADIDARTSTDSTPLLFAAKYKHNEVAKILLKKGANVDAKNGKDKSALYYAVEKRNSVLAKCVIEHNPVINDKIRQAVRRIILYDHANSVIVKDLAEYGFTFNSEDLNDIDLFKKAVDNGYTRIVEWSLSHVENPNPKFDLPLLHWAVGSGHKEIIELLIKLGWAVNGKNEMGNMPIYYLLSLRDNIDLCAEIAQLLMRNGADIQGASPLFFQAIDTGRLELYRILIDNGANTNCRNERDETPLHVILLNKGLFYPCQVKKTEADLSKSEGGEITKLLLQNSADLNARTRAGQAPIHLAAMHGIEEALRILLDHGADVNAIDGNRNTPLHLIISRKLELWEQCWNSQYNVEFERAEEQILELLLHNGADVNCKTANGLTPLHLAARHQSSHVPRLLLRYGADVDSHANEDDSTPLHFACQEGKQLMVQVLLSNGANIEACQRNGMRPLHSAALFGNADVVDALLEFNAEIDAQEGLNETAFHCAVINNHCAVVNSLLNNGCDINIVNNCGLTAFEIAVSKYSEDIQSFIEEFDFESLRNTDDLLACFITHIIKLDVAGFYVCDNILGFLISDSELIDLQQKCEEEIRRMKDELLLDQYTLHGVFVKRRHPIHMRNEALRNALDLFDFSAYPVYEPLLRSTIKKSGERIKLLDSGSKSLKILMQTSNMLNPQQSLIPSAEMLEEMVSYFGQEDLKNLIRCCENLKRQLCQ